MQYMLTTIHDDVIKWKHFPRYWPFVRVIHRSLVNSPTQRPVTQSFDVFFDLCKNKWLSKHSWGWWFETPSRPLWRHCNEVEMYSFQILWYIIGKSQGNRNLRSSLLTQNTLNNNWLQAYIFVNEWWQLYHCYYYYYFCYYHHLTTT